MSDNNLDLITELISGSLSPEERRVALERVAADPELQSEYEAQLAVSSLLSGAPSPTMTASERSDLRSALRDQLHLDAAPAPVVAAPSRWQRWWAPVAGLAAAAAVVVGVIVVLPDGGSDDSLQFAAAEVETTVQASATDAIDPGGTADTSGSAAEELTTTSLAAAEEAAPSVAADDATDGTPEAAGEAPPEPLPHLAEVDLGELGTAYAEGPDEFETELETSSVAPAPRKAVDTSACLGTVGDGADENVVTIVATGTIEGIDVIVEVVAPPSEEPYLVARNADTCEEFASTRP